MKNLLSLLVLAGLTAGCISDNSSVEPRTVFKLDRSGSAIAPLPGATLGSPSGTNGLATDTNGFGVAPYISQPTATATTETGSTSGANGATSTTPTGAATTTTTGATT